MRFPLRTALVAFLFGASLAHSEVVLPKLFGDHVVLQRDRPVPLWGRAAAGETVTVRFAGQEKSTRAAADGRWKLLLEPLPASGTPQEMMVIATNTVTLRDVLVGEVWLCSGQSNMEMALGILTAGAQPESAHDPALAEELKTASYPAIRLFRVEKKRQPPDVVSDGWTESRGDALARFSAAAFFFGRELHRELGVPIGLIQSAWGGSRLEEWISDEAYSPLEKILGPDAERTFERDASFVSHNYDTMIAPLAPFALGGVLWYQGESQIIAYNDGLRYADKINALIKSWRVAWSQPDLPFYSVQLAPYFYTQRKDKLAHGDDELPKFWEAQLRSTAIPGTAIIPITDTVDDVTNIHPGKKAVVGHRLAARALAQTYGKKEIVADGPIFTRAEINGATARIFFSHADGLNTRDGQPPRDFELAGADDVFFPATAILRGDVMELTSTQVPAPVVVRFGWHETSRPNLQNRAGWPAYPFRSDGPTWKPAN